MRTATTFRPGSTIGRPKGAKNRIRREVRVLLLKLEREGDFDPAKIFRRLQTLALTAEPGPAVAAARALLEYRFGKPLSSLEVEMQHEVGPSIVELLEGIATSDRHRAALEERERRRLANTVTIEPEEPA